MARILCALAAVGLLSVTIGCSTPRSPIPGPLYTNVKDVLIANPGPVGASPKVGTSEAKGIIGITLGDCSVEKAMQNGGISKIHYVDYESWGIMGIYAITKTHVHGE